MSKILLLTIVFSIILNLMSDTKLTLLRSDYEEIFNPVLEGITGVLAQQFDQIFKMKEPVQVKVLTTLGVPSGLRAC